MRETKFKHTEIGPIPHDWKVKRLGELSYITTGSKNTQDNVSNGIYPFFVRSPKVERINSYSFDCEAVLTVGDGVGTGKVFHYTNGKFDVHQRVYVITRYTSELHGKFLFWYLKENFYNCAIAGSVKTTVDSIRKPMLLNLEIPLPPHVEQVAIGKALSDVDELIDGLRKLIDKKRNIKQGAMSSLLTGKLRLLGFIKDWSDYTIGSLTSVQAGATPSTENAEYWNGDIRWMNSGEINLKYVREVENRITQKGYNSTSTHMLPKHCVLLGLAGQGKTRGTAAINLIELCTNQSIAAIYPSESFNSFFLYHLLDSKYNDLRMLSSGEGARGGLTKRQIENYSVFMPSDKEEQEAIAKILTDMDDEIESLEKKLAKYEQVKQGMMTELLTGKIRLI